MNHVMLDIETLGQAPDSVITSIGAVQFDITNGKIGNTFRQDVSLESNFDLGRKVDPSTLRWWLKQSTDALKGLSTSFETGINLPEALNKLSKFFYTLSEKNIFVWGRGPRFDQAILTHAYVSLNKDIPWTFRNEMCVRTMEFLRPAVKDVTPKVDTGHGSDGMGLHDAVLDAKYQIAYVCNIFKALNDRDRLRQLIDESTLSYAAAPGVMSTMDCDKVINKIFPEIEAVYPGQKTFFKEKDTELKDIPGNHF